MTKEQYANKLFEMGFNVSLISGVIMIMSEDEKTAKKANKAIKELGYKSSWGWRIDKCCVTDIPENQSQ